MAWSARRTDWGLSKGWGRIGGFNPFAFGSVAGYWDFTDASTVTIESATISQILDKSGNGFHLTQTPGVTAPSYGSFDTTNYSAGVFGGTTQYMEYTGNLTNFRFLHDTSAGSTFVAWATKSSLGTQRPLFDTGGWTSSDRGVLLTITASNFSLASVVGDVSGTPTARTSTGSQAISANTPFVLSGRHSGGASNATVTARLNGQNATASATYTPYNTDPDKFFLGRSWNNGGTAMYWPGKVARLVLYYGSLSDATMTTLEAEIVK